MTRHSGRALNLRLLPRFIALWLTAAVVASACASGPGAADSSAKPTGPLKVVILTSPTSLDPTLDGGDPVQNIYATIYDKLIIQKGDDHALVPSLAESWSQVEPTRWRFKLKTGVKFHNGEPFNADSVIYSINAWKNIRTGTAAAKVAAIERAERVDDSTVDIVTAVPTAFVVYSFLFVQMLPPKFRAEVGDNFGLKPVGTGPWRVVEFDKGSQLRLERNPDYWGKRPAINEIQFRWAPDPNSRVALVESGEVDIAQDVLPSLAERVDKSGSARAVGVQSIRKIWLQLNVHSGPTANVKVRQAVNYAIDVESIIKNLFQGRAYGRDKGFLLPGDEGYQGDKLQAIYKYDPATSRRLLAEAGYPNGFELEFTYPNGRYVLIKEFSEAMAPQLEAVGIKVRLQPLEPAAFFGKLNVPNDKDKLPGINAIGQLVNFQHQIPQIYLNPGNGGYGWNDRTVTFYKSIEGERDASKRAALWTQFEDYVYKEWVPWVWLWYQQDVYGVNNRVNWKPSGSYLMDLQTASFK